MKAGTPVALLPAFIFRYADDCTECENCGAKTGDGTVSKRCSITMCRSRIVCRSVTVWSCNRREQAGLRRITLPPALFIQFYGCGSVVDEEPAHLTHWATIQMMMLTPSRKQTKKAINVSHCTFSGNVETSTNVATPVF